MARYPSSNRRGLRALAGGALVTAFATLSPAPAHAHFILETPASWMSQDSVGAPEKMGPCGNEAGGTPTGMVTTFTAGETISITINEVVPHPGHYRVALGMTGQASLPTEPVVTAGSTPCGTAAIENPAVFPVLADDLLDHTAAFTAPQTMHVTLPADVTCENCTLQIIEFMSDHTLNNPGGCFYHHCANINIRAAGSDAGAVSSGATSSSSAATTAASGATTTAASGAATTGSTTGGASQSSATTAASTGATVTSATGTGGSPAATATGGASASGNGGGEGSTSASNGSCGCSTPGSSGSVPAQLVGLMAIGMLLRGRRRR